MYGMIAIFKRTVLFKAQPFYADKLTFPSEISAVWTKAIESFL